MTCIFGHSYETVASVSADEVGVGSDLATFYLKKCRRCGALRGELEGIFNTSTLDVASITEAARMWIIALAKKLETRTFQKFNKNGTKTAQDFRDWQTLMRKRIESLKPFANPNPEKEAWLIPDLCPECHEIMQPIQPGSTYKMFCPECEKKKRVCLVCEKEVGEYQLLCAACSKEREAKHDHQA